jgi:hypothetical protein
VGRMVRGPNKWRDAMTRLSAPTPEFRWPRPTWDVLSDMRTNKVMRPRLSTPTPTPESRWPRPPWDVLSDMRTNNVTPSVDADVAARVSLVTSYVGRIVRYADKQSEVICRFLLTARTAHDGHVRRSCICLLRERHTLLSPRRSWREA